MYNVHRAVYTLVPAPRTTIKHCIVMYYLYSVY